jgi:hypothetical protein
MRAALAVVAFVVVLAAPTSAHAAVCADYPNQAAAQKAHDTRDADGDGIYCKSLPCPCLRPGQSGGGGGGGNPTPAPKPRASCIRPAGVQRLTFSKAKYPNIRRHFMAAAKKGWPRVMVLNRKGAAARRKRLLEENPNQTRVRPRRVPGRRGPRQGQRRSTWTCARDQPHRLDGGCRLCPEQREPLAWRVAGGEAEAVLRRHEVRIRLHVARQLRRRRRALTALGRGVPGGPSRYGL